MNERKHLKQNNIKISNLYMYLILVQIDRVHNTFSKFKPHGTLYTTREIDTETNSHTHTQSNMQTNTLSSIS